VNLNRSLPALSSHHIVVYIQQYDLSLFQEQAIFNRIAVLRAERALTRQQLADAVGVNYQTVGYLERGDYNPSLELALRLSEFFHLPVETVFSLKPFTPLSETLHPAATRKDK
jgi:putative transcriptional regulator